MKIHRALIKTHHMTSRKKITSIHSSTSKHNVSVLLKTGSPPGVMLAEGDSEEDVKVWVADVKRLRYKDYQLLKREEVMVLGEGEMGLGGIVGRGKVLEMRDLKDFARILGAEAGLVGWWRRWMGFLRGGKE